MNASVTNTIRSLVRCRQFARSLPRRTIPVTCPCGNHFPVSRPGFLPFLASPAPVKRQLEPEPEESAVCAVVALAETKPEHPIIRRRKPARDAKQHEQAKIFLPRDHDEFMRAVKMRSCVSSPGFRLEGTTIQKSNAQ